MTGMDVIAMDHSESSAARAEVAPGDPFAHDDHEDDQRQLEQHQALNARMLKNRVRHRIDLGALQPEHDRGQHQIEQGHKYEPHVVALEEHGRREG
jgi:hypothetical protein